MAALLAIAVIIPASPFAAYAAETDEFDNLREKYKIRLTGFDPANPYNPDDQYIKLNIQSIDENVKKNWSAMNSVYTWDDIMKTSSTNADNLNSIIGRLKRMALGWATFGSEYYNNEKLLNDTIAGLEWFYNNRCNENTEWYYNWWYWEVGIPTDLNDTVILLYDKLTPSQITNYMNFVKRWTPTVYYSSIIKDDGKPHPFTGANLISKCKVAGIWAILVKDPAMLQESSDGLNDVFQYTTSLDGFYTDGSFIQHQDHPYAGGYGRTLITGISDVLWLLDGSTWKNNSPDKANVNKWILETYEPAMYRGETFASVRGRDMSRPPSQASSGFEIISSIILLSDIPSNTSAGTLKSIVKYHLQNGYQDSYLRTCGIWNIVKAKSILNSAQVTPRPELTGNYQFYNQDRVVHRSQGWAFDIAMHSTRIDNYEAFSKENLKGWYTGDGMTYLYTNPSDYAFNFWPTVDAHRLPGITTDRCITRPECTGEYRSTTPWAGGVSLEGIYGSAGMDFKQHNSKVTPVADVSAKKSWFMFDDEIVSLGAGITSKSGRTIETVADNRLLNSQGANQLTVNGAVKPSTLGWFETMNNVNWIHLDGTGGYVFPGGTSLNGLREKREGSYYDINRLYPGVANDEFNSTAQGGMWLWVREDAYKHSLTGTSLNITAQQGTLEGAVNTTKNIMLARAPQYDFYSETKLDFSPEEVGQEAGLILYMDDDDYVYISRKYTASGLMITAVSENGGIAAGNTFKDEYGATVYFKIEKCGNDYLLYASSDGQTWGTALHTCTNTMAGPDGVNSGLKMGLFAQNGNNPSVPEITASFDYFHMKLVRNYMTLWKDHGVNPVDDTYSYITLPNKTAQEIGDYSNNPDVTILKNDKTVQAVKENTLGIIGANFWSPGSVSYITAYDPAAVMVKDKNNRLEVAVSDPTHSRSRSAVKVELCKSGLSVVSSDPTVTVLQMSPTIILEVDITGAGATKGKTHNIAISYDPLAPTLLPRTIIQLKPAADAYVVDGRAADTNFGATATLAVHNAGTSGELSRESYLKFNLNSIPEDAVIESAKLYILGAITDSDGTEANIKAYGIDDDSWKESGITWNKKPGAGAQLGEIHVAGLREWYEIDVTAYVQSQYAGDKVVSLSLAQDSAGLYTLFSGREDSSYPYLALSLARKEYKQFTDELNNWDNVYSHSEYLIFDVGNPSYFEGDTSRVKRRKSDIPNELVYYPECEIANFSARIYYQNGINGKINMYTSPDGIDWTRLSIMHDTAVNTVGSWYRVNFSPAENIPTGTYYLKIELLNDPLIFSPQLSQLTIDYPVAYTAVEITSFDEIADISAGPAGSAIYADAAAVIAALPASVKANGNAVEVPVTVWTDTDGYDPNVTGSYTFTATLGAIPSGYANTGNHTATVEVVVETVAAPVIQSAVAGDGHVKITWGAVNGSTGYEVYASTVSNSYPVPVTTVAGLVYNYDVTGLTNGTTYYFAVKAVNPGGNSDYSNELSATPQVAAPGAPVIQSAVAGDGHVNITWSAVTGSTGYEVYASTVSNSYPVPVTTVAGLVYDYDVTGLTNGTTYYFTVKAVNPGGSSDYSNELSAVPQVAAPGVPVIQSAVAGDGHVKITWSPVNGSTGYEVYTSTVSNSYSVPVTTVAGLVYDYDVTGLTNGTTYYFTVKAINAGGDSPHSAEVSATPRTVPGAPVNVMAAAGDGQAAISFAAPSDNGGSPVTEYIVTSNPGGITARGTGTSIIVAGLSNGTAYTFTVRAVNAAGSSMESAASNTVTPYAPSSEDDEDDSEDDSTPPANTPEQEQTMPAGAGIETLVNGNAVTMATAATTVIEGKTVTTISIDDKRVEEILQNQGDNALLTLSAENDADVIVSRLNAQTVRRMEAAGAALEIRTANVIYTLPAAQISIDNVLSQLGGQVEPEDITVNIKVSEPPEDIIKIIEDTADKNNYQIVVKPVEFEITCTSGDKTVNISKFNGYIERMIAIPEGVDPARITTGVVLNPDGTFSHVPTVITVIDGKYYAKISSVTNSTYSVIWNLKSFKDVEAHWAKDAVNDMGSRLIINGVSEEMFEPERDISRAEFMAIVVKALGLMKPGAGKDVFGDVAKAAWYYDAVSAAYEYGIIAGYENSKFEPDCKITREQAMVMIARAMKTANLKVEFDGGEEDKLLENYIDADKSADYAKSSIAACIKAGIVNGRNDNLVAPKDYITRAEAAIIVRRLLQKSNLI
jgi:regulation of enolase protein 1 (concanavalin A-like superfamily)